MTPEQKQAQSRTNSQEEQNKQKPDPVAVESKKVKGKDTNIDDIISIESKPVEKLAKEESPQYGSEYGSEEDIEAYSERPATVIDVEQAKLENLAKSGQLNASTAETMQQATVNSQSDSLQQANQLSPLPPTAAEAEAQIGQTLTKPRTKTGIESLLAGLGPEAQKQILRAQAEQLEVAAKQNPQQHTDIVAEGEMIDDDEEVAGILSAKVNRDKHRQQKLQQQQQQQMQQQLAAAAMQHKQQQLATATAHEQQQSLETATQQPQATSSTAVTVKTGPHDKIPTDELLRMQIEKAKATSAVSQMPQSKSDYTISQTDQNLNTDLGAASMEDLQSIGSDTPGSKKKGGFFNLPSIRKKKDKNKGSTESLPRSLAAESPQGSPKASPSRLRKPLFGGKKPPPVMPVPVPTTADLTATAVTSEIWQEALTGQPIAVSEGVGYQNQKSGSQPHMYEPQTAMTAEDQTMQTTAQEGHTIQTTVMGGEMDPSDTVKKKGGFFSIGSKRKQKKAGSKENLTWAQPYGSTPPGNQGAPPASNSMSPLQAAALASISTDLKTAANTGKPSPLKPPSDSVARPPQLGAAPTSPVKKQYGAVGDTDLAAQLWAEKRNMNNGSQSAQQQQQQRQKQQQQRRQNSRETNIDQPYNQNASFQAAAMATVLGNVTGNSAQSKVSGNTKFQPIPSEGQATKKQQLYDDSGMASQLWLQGQSQPSNQQSRSRDGQIEENVAMGTESTFAAVPTEEAYTDPTMQPKTNKKSSKQVKIKDGDIDDAPNLKPAQPFHAAALASVTAHTESTKQIKSSASKPENVPASIIRPQPVYATSQKPPHRTDDGGQLAAQLWSEQRGVPQNMDDSTEDAVTLVTTDVMVHQQPSGAAERKRGTNEGQKGAHSKHPRQSNEDAQSTGFSKYPTQPLQDVAMQSIVAGLQYQQPITRAEKNKDRTRAPDQKYRSNRTQYEEDDPESAQQQHNGSSRYGDSQLASQLWAQQRNKNATTDSEGEADTEDLPMDISMDSSVFVPRSPNTSNLLPPQTAKTLTSTPEGNEGQKPVFIQGSKNEPHAFQAVQKGTTRQVMPPSTVAKPPSGYYQKETSLGPGRHSPTGSATTASVDLDNRKQRPRRKGRRTKDEAPKTDTGPVDLNQFNMASQLWMEQVDKNNYQKSKSMLLSVVPTDQSLPDELVQNMPHRSHTEATDELAPQWVIARGRTKKKRKTQFQTPEHYSSQQSFRDRYLSSATSDSELDISRPMSPGRQLLLFFRIGSNWRDLAWVLFEDVQKDAETLKMIKDIQMQNPGQLTGQVNDMMHRWWRRRGNDATIEELQRALDMIQLGYIREEFYDQSSNITSYTPSDSELDIGEISDADPDVKRLLDEYEFRSKDATFDYDSGTESRSRYSADNLSRSGRGSRPSSRNSGRFRFSSSRESLDDDTFERSRKTSFVIIQPQLSNPDYRHETTI